jgi:hypothetical protein
MPLMPRAGRGHQDIPEVGGRFLEAARQFPR